MSTLTEYGHELARAGFAVWHTPVTGGGYLTYRAPNGSWGTLQGGSFGEWQHLMPLVPSREHGSSMHLDTRLDPFTVAAAEECAQPFNRNSVVGRQANAGRAYLSPRSVPLAGHAYSHDLDACVCGGQILWFEAEGTHGCESGGPVLVGGQPTDGRLRAAK